MIMPLSLTFFWREIEFEDRHLVIANEHNLKDIWRWLKKAWKSLPTVFPQESEFPSISIVHLNIFLGTRWVLFQLELQELQFNDITIRNGDCPVTAFQTLIVGVIVWGENITWRMILKRVFATVINWETKWKRTKYNNQTIHYSDVLI